MIFKLPRQSYIIIIFLLIILGLSFFIRLSYFSEYPLSDGEAQRDYLVGHHIIADMEFPLTGPQSGIFHPLRNSPLNYYLASTILLIYDDFKTLTFVNIILQVFTVLLVFLLAREVFNSKTALISSLLYSLSWETVRQSAFWRHIHLVVPFIILSYLLLLLAYRRKSYIILLTSIFFVFLSAAIHTSVYTILPVFVLLGFWILKMEGRSFGYYFGLALTSVISYLVFNLTVLWFHLDRGYNSLAVISRELIYSPIGFFHNFWYSIVLVIDSLFNVIHQSLFSLNFLLFLTVLFITLIYTLIFKKDSLQKTYLTIMTVFIILPIIFISFFKEQIFVHYFYITLPLIIIIISQIFNVVFSNNLFSKSACAILIILLTFQFSRYFVYDHNLFSRNSVISQPVAIIAKEILDIQKTNKYEKKDFFNIEIWDRNSDADPLIFWVPLSRLFGEKFTRIDNGDGANIMILNKNQNSGGTVPYQFLICNSYFSHLRNKTFNKEIDCLDKFKEYTPGYTILKQIYSEEPFNIYLAKTNK